MPPELILIDKPSGITSYEVIRRLKRHFGREHKIGHAGTLDPLASGLLLVGMGAGTKKLTKLIADEKDYDAEILLGEAYTTGDRTGALTANAPVPPLTRDDITPALESLRGCHVLPVSAYSAMKRGGVPWYRRAQQAAARGEPIPDGPPRVMEVRQVTLLAVSYPTADRVRIDCDFTVGSGTYIRSLAEELGRRLGYPATLFALRRTRIGDFHVGDAQSLDEFPPLPTP
jgi:tRNA pseudouridine55 synthase